MTVQILLGIVSNLVVHLLIALLSRRVRNPVLQPVILSLIAASALTLSFLIGNKDALLPKLAEIAFQTSQPLLEVASFQVDISHLSELNRQEENLGLQPGENTLAGIMFETGWATTTECSHLPNQPRSLNFDTNISNPTNVYFLLQAGYGDYYRDQDKIGLLRLWFSDGSSISEDLVLGYNIRDWNWSNPYAVSKTTALNVQPGWAGQDSAGRAGGMDILTFAIPENQRGLELRRIEVLDLSHEITQDINPCIHILAITVDYLQ